MEYREIIKSIAPYGLVRCVQILRKYSALNSKQFVDQQPGSQDKKVVNSSIIDEGVVDQVNGIDILKVSDGDLDSKSEVAAGCLNCQSYEYEPVYSDLRIVKCQKCGLVYSLDRLSFDELNKFYSEEYCELAKAGNYDAVGIPKEAVDAFVSTGDRSFFEDTSKFYVELIEKYLINYLKGISCKTFIEVGCAWGACLIAAEKFGYFPIGFEISKSNCEFGKKLGFNINNHEFTSAEIAPASAGIVFFSHSFEHIVTPNEYLAKAYSVLVRNGLLYIEVPNFNCYWRYRTDRKWLWLDPVAHVAQYTGNVLCSMVESAGFTIKECFTVSREQNGIYDLVSEEVNKYGNKLDKSEILQFIKSLEDCNMGENLIVIAQKV